MKLYQAVLTFLVVSSGYLFAETLDAQQNVDEVRSYSVYVEPSIQSEYGFIAPERWGKSILRKLENNRSIVESGVDPQKGRYQSSSGFALFRLSNDSSYYNSEHELQENVVYFLNQESNKWKVFFYNQIFHHVSYDLILSEGNIFSPTTGLGYYFLKKEKPLLTRFGTGQAYFFIYYSFEETYEVAKRQFEKISRHIYPISDGVMNFH